MKRFNLEYLVSNETKVVRWTCLGLLASAAILCCVTTKILDKTEKEMIKVLTDRADKRLNVEEKLD